MGAGIASLAGIVGPGTSRNARARGAWVRAITRARGGALGLPVVSPYAFHLPGYYRLMLFTSPVSKVIVEWQAPKPHGWYLVFFGLAVVTAILAVWQRRRLGWYEVAILAVTLAGSLRSGRGIVWFALAVLVLLPTALDGALGDRNPPLRRQIGLALGTTSLAVLALSVVAVAARANSWFEKEWTPAVPRVVARAAAEIPGQKAVFPTDMRADWLLWKSRSCVVESRTTSVRAGHRRAARVTRPLQEHGTRDGRESRRAIRSSSSTRTRARPHPSRPPRARDAVLYRDSSVVVLRRSTG